MRRVPGAGCLHKLMLLSWAEVAKQTEERSRRVPAPSPAVLWSGFGEETTRDKTFNQMQRGATSFKIKEDQFVALER